MTTETIYNYLKVQNRPYSANDIVTNLHNEIGKSAVQKALDQLVKTGKIFEKVYGKQKIYCVVQESSSEPEELMRIDKELQVHANEVETKYQELEKEIRAREKALTILKSSGTIEDACKRKEELQASIASLNEKLNSLKMSASGSEDLNESKRKAEKLLDGYCREYLKRKRLCTEILNCILENFPGSKSDLYEEIGIEERIVH